MSTAGRALDPIVIVGGGLAAARLVQAVRPLDQSVPLVMVSAESRLPYDRPPLSKGFLGGTFDEARLPLTNEELWDDVDVRLGMSAVGLSVSERSVTLSDGSTVSGEHVVVATGSAARTIPGWPTSPRILTLRSLDDSRALASRLAAGSRLAIVGGGFIGCEVAATARGLGVDVTVIDVLDVPCVRGLGPELGAVVADLHRRHDVDLRMGVGVDDVVDTGESVDVALADGSTLTADTLLVAIGAAPVTSWLEGSADGPDAELVIDNGVVCDDHLRAVNGGAHVWAIGDVARWASRRAGGLTRVEHWTNAIDQAQQVAHNLLGTDRAGPYDPVQFVWSDQYDALIQVVGHVADAERLETVSGDLSKGKALLAAVTGADVVGLVGWSNARLLMRCRGLLDDGVTIDALRAHVEELSRPRP